MTPLEGLPNKGQLTLLPGLSTVIGTMSVRKIQIGQLWKQLETGDTYLVTRVYNEALSTMVILRKSGAEDESQVRLKVERTPEGQGIPGFTPAMEDDSV
jgi:hypothetical protein